MVGILPGAAHGGLMILELTLCDPEVSTGVAKLGSGVASVVALVLIQAGGVAIGRAAFSRAALGAKRAIAICHTRS